MKTYLIEIILMLQLAAQAQLIESFSGGDDLAVGPGTAGYSFTVGSESVTVHGLGVWASSGSELFSDHQIGIWDTTPSHNLLASVTVQASSAIDINGFWYAPISPLTLNSGTTYRIGAQYADPDFDLVRGNATSLTMNSATYGHSYLSSGIGFEFPDVDVSAADRGFFGPNASFTPVPEPTATAIVTAAGLAVLAAIRRWKARQAAGAAAA